MTAQRPQRFLGIDGGGSKCKAVIVDAAGRVLGEGGGGPANPYQQFEQSLNSIKRATHDALAAAGLAASDIGSLHACLGLAGVNLPVVHQRMRQWPHPYASLRIVSDLHVACIGAHAGGDGAVMIAGTGSCGYARVQQQEWQYGGHGFPAGDKGSGAWLGLEAVKQALLTLDGFADATLLTQQLLTALQVNDAIELIERVGQGASAYAKLAPLVFASAEAGDPVARAIIGQGADYLSTLARKLLHAKPPRLALIGGIAPLMTPWLAPDIQAALSPALEAPEHGAVRVAMANLQHEKTAS